MSRPWVTCHAGWLWAGILMAAGLYVTCRTSPAIGQARDDESAATAAVDEQTDQEADTFNSRRTGKPLFETDDRSSSRTRKVGTWKWRNDATTKSNSKPAPRFNPFGRAKTAPPRDPFVESDTGAEPDPSALPYTGTNETFDRGEGDDGRLTPGRVGKKFETDSEDSTEAAPSTQPNLKIKRKPAPQGRKRLLRYQSSTSSTSPADQSSISEKLTPARPTSASTSRSEAVLKNVSGSEIDSESHLRSLFEDPEETRQVAPKSSNVTSKPAVPTHRNATSELEIQRIRPRRTITTRTPRTTLPRATDVKSPTDAPAARAQVDQPADEPVARVAPPTIRPAPKPINQMASTQAAEPTRSVAAVPAAKEPEFGPPLMQPTTHSMRSTVSSSLQSVANRPFQIEPPVGWSAATKPREQNSSGPAMMGHRVPKAIGESPAQPELPGAVAGQLEFPPLPGVSGNEIVPTNLQPVTIDSIEDATPVQTTHAEDTSTTFDTALFVQEQSAPNPEPARIQDSFPEPVVSAELAKQNQSPWLWWMLTAFGTGFGLCLMWCVWLRKATAE